ncbi:MAG: Na+/H+ antiporter NhaA, partial [Bacteroides sp.]
SLFITNLSFGEGQAVLLNQAKFGVLLGTLVAGMLGFLYLRWALAYDERKLKH